MINSHSVFKILLVTALGISPMLCQAEIIVGKQTSSQRVVAMASDKTALSTDEQQFAMKLSALHRQIFTMVFTPDLRKEAMALMTIPSDDMDDDTPMTADMAVEEVISNHRDMPSSQPGQVPGKNAQPSNASSKGSAPAKQTQHSSTTSKKKSYWSS
jgi:hypothetical protein